MKIYISRIFSSLSKNITYILPFSFFVGILIFTWYLFFFKEIISDSEKRIAGLISILGLSFGLFQFWFNSIDNKRKRLFDLRYESYKEIIKQIDSISEILDSNMSGQSNINVYSIVSQLMTNINRLRSTININNEYLFPKLDKHEETEILNKILKDILLRTDKLRIEIDNVSTIESRSIESKSIESFAESIFRMNWHNDVRDYHSELHTAKYGFYKILRKYL